MHNAAGETFTANDRDDNWYCGRKQETATVEAYLRMVMKQNSQGPLQLQVGKLRSQVDRLGALINRLANLLPVPEKVLPLLMEGEHGEGSSFPSDPIRPKDAARLLNVHPSMISRLMKQGKLRFWKLPGGHARVSRAEVLSLPVLGNSA